MIVDSDPIGLKLIEHINSRARSAEFASFPIIGTLAIIADNLAVDVTDFVSLLDEAGGVQMVIRAPFETKFAMKTLMEMVFHSIS